jgi:hypothetical protein
MASLLAGLQGVPVEGWGEGRLLGAYLPPALPPGWRWQDSSSSGVECLKEGALRKAYQLAVRCLHPDKTQGLPLALRLAGGGG